MATSQGSVPNTESVLTENFKTVLSKSLRSQGSSNRILLDELDGLQGRADLVIARIDFKALPDVPCLEDLAVTLRLPAKARLLAMLRYGASRTRPYLARVTGFSDNSLGSHIRQLESVGLARVHGNSSVSLNYRLPWSMVDIETYEVKLYNWRRALHQAMGYRSFSHSVRVVMPPPGARVRQKTHASIPQHRDRTYIYRERWRHTYRDSKQEAPPSSEPQALFDGSRSNPKQILGREGTHIDASNLNRSTASSHCSR